MLLTWGICQCLHLPSLNQRWTLIFTGVSAIHISKWDIMVIRAHHWIWEKMDALEALTIHSDRLADLAFTGAAFLYAERIVTDLTAVIKEGLQLWLHDFKRIFRYIQARTNARLIQYHGEFDKVTKGSTDINSIQMFINEGQRGLVFTNTYATRLQNGCC